MIIKKYVSQELGFKCEFFYMKVCNSSMTAIEDCQKKLNNCCKIKKWIWKKDDKMRNRNTDMKIERKKEWDKERGK